MMDNFDLVVNAIQQLGFPIVCVAVLFFLLYKNMEYQKNHDAETARLISENTAAINSMKELINHLHNNDME